jgi:hypothetical protein
MALATAQFTQGVTIGGSGKSVFGFTPGALVTMTDDGGAGAISYLWEFLSWPSPLGSPPAISNDTLQVATVTPTLDGVYIVKLTRVDGTGTTTDIKFFGVSDEDALTLPSAGQTGNMTNQTALTQAVGWSGRQNASTNFQLDAFLRFLKARVGRYVGHVQAVSHVSASPVTVQLTDGADKPYRVIGMSGAGSLTNELVIPALSDGKRFRFLVAMTLGAGNFVLKNGVSGTTLNTLQAPPLGTITYELEAVYDGSNWVATSASLADAQHLRKYEIVELLAGNRSTDQTLFTRLGTGRADPTKFPSNTQIKFVACVEATVGKIVEVRLYNLTNGGYVAAAMSSGSTTPDTLEQVVTLPAGLRDYEVHIRMTVTGGPTDRVTCTNARLVFTWG